MKRFFSLLVVGFICLFLVAGGVQAYSGRGFFENPPIGARATAMKSFVSVADDPNAIFLNPAGLANLSSRDFLSTYVRLFPGIEGGKLQQGLIGYVQPMGDFGAVGVGEQYFFSSTPKASSNIITFSYGRRAFGNLSLGSNLKIMTWSADLAENEPKDRINHWSMAIDFGLLWSPFPKVMVGAFLRDINRPNIAAGYKGNGGVARTAELPMGISAGLSYRISPFLVSAEFSKEGDEQEIFIGTERTLPYGFSVRGGSNWNSLQGKAKWGRASLGFGYEFKNLRLNYSWTHFAQIPEARGVHRLSLGYRF